MVGPVVDVAPPVAIVAQAGGGALPTTSRWRGGCVFQLSQVGMSGSASCPSPAAMASMCTRLQLCNGYTRESPTSRTTPQPTRLRTAPFSRKAGQERRRSRRVSGRPPSPRRPGIRDPGTASKHRPPQPRTSSPDGPIPSEGGAEEIGARCSWNDIGRGPLQQPWQRLPRQARPGPLVEGLTQHGAATLSPLKNCGRLACSRNRTSTRRRRTSAAGHSPRTLQRGRRRPRLEPGWQAGRKVIHHPTRPPQQAPAALHPSLMMREEDHRRRLRHRCRHGVHHGWRPATRSHRGSLPQLEQPWQPPRSGHACCRCPALARPSVHTPARAKGKRIASASPSSVKLSSG